MVSSTFNEISSSWCTEASPQFNSVLFILDHITTTVTSGHLICKVNTPTTVFYSGGGVLSLLSPNICSIISQRALVWSHLTKGQNSSMHTLSPVCPCTHQSGLKMSAEVEIFLVCNLTVNSCAVVFFSETKIPDVTKSLTGVFAVILIRDI